jgi:hypothetical protein
VPSKDVCQLTVADMMSLKASDVLASRVFSKDKTGS